MAALTRLMEARTRACVILGAREENQGSRNRIRGGKLLEAIKMPTLKPTSMLPSRRRGKPPQWKPTSGSPLLPRLYGIISAPNILLPLLYIMQSYLVFIPNN